MDLRSSCWSARHVARLTHPVPPRRTPVRAPVGPPTALYHRPLHRSAPSIGRRIGYERGTDAADARGEGAGATGPDDGHDPSGSARCGCGRAGRHRPGRHVAAVLDWSSSSWCRRAARRRVKKNSQIDSLKSTDVVPVDLTVTRCLALVGERVESGGFECTAPTPTGRHVHRGVPDRSTGPSARRSRHRRRRRPGAVLDPRAWPPSRSVPCACPAAVVLSWPWWPGVVVLRRRGGVVGLSGAGRRGGPLAPRYRCAWPPTRTSPLSRAIHPAVIKADSRERPADEGPQTSRSSRDGRPDGRPGAPHRPGRGTLAGSSPSSW